MQTTGLINLSLLVVFAYLYDRNKCFLCCISKLEEYVINLGQTYQRWFIHYEVSDMSLSKLLRPGQKYLMLQSCDMQFYLKELSRVIQTLERPIILFIYHCLI